LLKEGEEKERGAVAPLGHPAFGSGGLNPSLSPFNKGRLCVSPFGKGGLRGIFTRGRWVGKENKEKNKYTYNS